MAISTHLSLNISDFITFSFKHIRVENYKKEARKVSVNITKYI